LVPQERLDSAIPLLAGNFTDLRICCAPQAY
jgi:hypothetical protein